MGVTKKSNQSTIKINWRMSLIILIIAAISFGGGYLLGTRSNNNAQSSNDEGTKYLGVYSDGEGNTVTLRPNGICNLSFADSFPEEYKSCTYQIKDGDITISYYGHWRIIGINAGEGYELQEKTAALGESGFVLFNKTYTKL